MSILLHLSLIDNIGSATILNLMRVFGAEEQLLTILYSLNVKELQKLTGLSEERAQAIKAGLANTKLLDDELALIEKYHITLVTLADESYPAYLRIIHYPPIILYIKGTAGISSDKHLAVVGSRKADQYGAYAVDAIVPPLVQYGWTIVSGGAHGIDSMAHKATLAAGGKTIVVLGFGLLRSYPVSHGVLFKKVVDAGGAVINLFPLMSDPLPGFFPARNRIIAGLSKGCLVVQAGMPSGALITAQHALNEGREVFAVPGSIDNPLSIGCHKLISEGAMLTTSAADILIAFGHMRDAPWAGKN